MQQTPGYDYSDAAEAARILETAERVLGFKFEKIERSGSAANLVGLKSERVLFSQRIDSRTYFAQDVGYGIGRDAGVFQGPDGELFTTCRSLMRELGIPTSEILHEGLLQEHLQVAQAGGTTGEPVIEDPERGKKLARISRQIDGIPVWSSSLLLGLTRDRRPGYMQLHWPEVPAHTVAEAQRLRHLVQSHWRPPEVEGAQVESVESGIIHSPAIGFMMDIYPAIRVIYRSEGRVGKKAVRYLDRHGQDVPAPRQIETPKEEAVARARPRRTKQ
jgi:hypothetical protein